MSKHFVIVGESGDQETTEFDNYREAYDFFDEAPNDVPRRFVGPKGTIENRMPL